ncbi:MAG TPA: hypothetical protein VGK52_10815 [Polyangia bacterium]
MSMSITRVTLLGALASGLGLLVTTTQGCDGTAGSGGPAMEAGFAGATDASATDAGATDAGAMDAGGGDTTDAGNAGAAGVAGGTSGTAGSTPATCDTTCAKADACCNAINVTYDHGADKCAYATMCAAGQGADACAMYLQVLPQLLLPGMPLPAACE